MMNIGFYYSRRERCWFQFGASPAVTLSQPVIGVFARVARSGPAAWVQMATFFASDFVPDLPRAAFDFAGRVAAPSPIRKRPRARAPIKHCLTACPRAGTFFWEGKKRKYPENYLDAQAPAACNAFGSPHSIPPRVTAKEPVPF
jgi:hypothetical protein